MKTKFTKLTTLAIAGLLAAGVAQADIIDIPVVNGSFENADNFLFTDNANNIPLAATNVGQWVVRAVDEDNEMDLADITSAAIGGTGNSYTQDGSSSLLFQATADRGAVQIVDVSAMSVIGKELQLSAIVSSRSSGASGMELVGFNDFTDLTVDLGGNWHFTGGTYTIVATDTKGPADTDDISQVWTISATAASEYNYLAIILAGLAGERNLDTNWVAFDDVTLSVIP